MGTYQTTKHTRRVPRHSRHYCAADDMAGWHATAATMSPPKHAMLLPFSFSPIERAICLTIDAAYHIRCLVFLRHADKLDIYFEDMLLSSMVTADFARE